MRRVFAVAIVLAALALPETAEAQDATLRTAQTLLIERGYKPVLADGFFGTKTRDALRAFQRDNHLPISGKLDQATMQTLVPAVDPPKPPSLAVVEELKPDIAPAITPQLKIDPIAVPILEPAITAAIGQPPAIVPPHPNIGNGVASGPPIFVLSILGLGMIALALMAGRIRSPKRLLGTPLVACAPEPSAVKPPELTAGFNSTQEPSHFSSGVSMTKYTLIPIVDPVSNLANTSAKAIPATVINSAPNKSIQEGVWIERGQTVVVAGVSITGGFFYFGEKLGEETWREENCLVRPSLKVAATSRWTGEPMSYYPSYSTISPEFRLGYLQWLASERSDPNTNIGFVYLYFYGIEYYVFKKKIGNKRIELITEAKRLLTIYTQNAHFVRYVRQFIAAVEIEDKNYLVQPQIRIESGYHTEMPLHTRLYLGDLLTRKQPFSKDDALIWLAGTTGNSFRSPAVRCAVEFKRLWDIKFGMHFKGGMRVAPPKTTFQPVYRAASQTFQCVLDPSLNVPDIGALEAPLKKLREISEECTSALEGLSRLVGRSPSQRGSAAAFLLLPAELRTGIAAEPFTNQLRELMGENPFAEVGFSELCTRMRIRFSDDGRVPTAILTQLGQMLDELNFGVEPDRRYGNSTPTGGSIAVIFPAPHGGPVEAIGGAYQTARLIAEIGVAAAASDGQATEDEFEVLRTYLCGLQALSPPELLRVTAYARCLWRLAPNQNGILKKLAELPVTSRHAIGDVAINIVRSDGKILLGEVKFIERLYAALGLPVSDVYSALHNSSSGVARANGSGTITNVASTHGQIAIDPTLLEQRRKDTKEVGALLAGIFTDELAASSGLPEAPRESEFTGLDAAHVTLLTKIAAIGKLSRAEFDTLARSSNLLPDGAIETINEWAFEHGGEPLLEEDNGILVVVGLLPGLIEIQEPQ